MLDELIRMKRGDFRMPGECIRNEVWRLSDARRVGSKSSAGAFECSASAFEIKRGVLRVFGECIRNQAWGAFECSVSAFETKCGCFRMLGECIRNQVRVLSNARRVHSNE